MWPSLGYNARAGLEKKKKRACLTNKQKTPILTRIQFPPLEETQVLPHQRVPDSRYRLPPQEVRVQMGTDTHVERKSDKKVECHRGPGSQDGLRRRRA